MKIFLGCHEIANLLKLYSEAFKMAGHDVTTFVFEPNHFYPHNKYDYIAEIAFKRFFFFLTGSKFEDKVRRRFRKIYAQYVLRREISKNTDIFIFIWSSLLPDNEDLNFIKKHNKKIIFINCGSDVRHSDPFIQEFGIDRELWKKDYPSDPLNKKIQYLRNMEIYADLILSVPDQSGLAIRPYFHLKIPFVATIQISPRQQNIVPSVIHCPTRRFIKGSDLIEEALEKLRAKGVSFSYQRVAGLPNHELLAILEHTDIVVDELLLPGPGVLGFEAMAAGCIECTRHIPNPAAGWVPPVVSIDRENICIELERILTLDITVRQEMADKGQKYVSENHLPSRIASEILSWLKDSTTPHYVPSFYLSSYVPQDEKPTPKSQDLSTKVVLIYGCDRKLDLLNARERGVINISDEEISQVRRY